MVECAFQDPSTHIASGNHHRPNGRERQVLHSWTTSHEISGVWPPICFQVSRMHAHFTDRAKELKTNLKQELAIVASLTSLVLEVVRYHLLNDGLDLWFIESGLTLASPTWLRSARFISQMKTSFTRRTEPSSNHDSTRSCFTPMLRSKVVLFVLLFICSSLVGTVGPASALLFLPSQLWIKATSTHFYIGGLEDVLWPTVLTHNHTGHDSCDLSPLRMDFSSCMYASLKVLMGAASVPRPTRPGFTFYIPGGTAHQFPPPSLVVGNLPTPEEDYRGGDPDTWAVAPHLAVVSHMDNLKERSNDAFKRATGWRKRLDSSGGSRIILTEGGKFPITRTVCSDRVNITGPLSKLAIPILDETKFWRTKDVAYSTGPLAQVDFTTLGLAEWNALQPNAATTLQSRAKWLPLPSNLGSGSALVVQLVQSPEITWAYTCVVDARWATGQTMHSDRSMMWSWESHPGIQPFDQHSSIGTWSLGRTSMFDPDYTSFYSKPIQVEQSWLDALTPTIPEASMPGNDLVMNSFEALLNQSGLPRADQYDDRYGTINVEYVSSSPSRY